MVKCESAGTLIKIKYNRPTIQTINSNPMTLLILLKRFKIESTILIWVVILANDEFTVKLFLTYSLNLDNKNCFNNE